MKNYKRFFVIALALLLIAGLCACTPIEENINTPELKYDTLFPQTQAEYKLAVNSHITTYLNYLETHIASGNSVLNGTSLATNEIKAAKNSLELMQNAYAKMEKVYPPTDMATTHASVLLQMKEAINSVDVYIEYLEQIQGEDVSDPTLRANIEATIAIMQTEFTSLKGVFSVT